MAADLKILITAQNLARAALQQVQQDLGRVNQQASFASRGMSGLQGVVGGGLKLAVGAGTAVLGGLTAGMGALVGSGVALNSSLENVEAQLLAFTKDGDVAKGILEQIRTEAATTPFAFEEMARATASLLPAAKQSGAELMDLVRTAEILAASNPAEGLEGAAFAIREALSGDFTSIVERFNLPRQRLKELKDEGVPAMEAISIAMKEMGLDADLVTNLAGTMSGRWSTFMDTIDTLKGTLAKPMFNLLSSGLVRVQKLLDANMPALTEFAEAVGTKLADAVETATVFVTSFIDVLGNSDSVIVALKWALIDAFGEDTPWVQGIFNASRVMRGFIGQLSQIAMPVVRLVREFFNWKDVLGAVGIVIASIVLPALWGMVTAATPVIAMFVALVAGVSVLRNAWERDWGGIQEKTQSAWAVIQTVFDGMRTALTTGDFGPLLETLEGLWSQLQSWMATIATTIRENAATWLTAMSDWAVGLWGTVSPWLVEMAGKLANWLVLQSIVLRTQAATWATALAEWAVGVWEKVSPWLVEMASKLANWVILQGLALRMKVKDWAAGFVDWAGDIWEKLSEKLGTMWESLTTWISNQVDVLYPFIYKWTTEFFSWAGEIWTELSPKLVEMFTSLGTWIGEQAVALPEKLAGWKTSFVDWATDAWTKLQPTLTTYSSNLIAWAQEQGPKLEQETKKWEKFFSKFMPKMPEPSEIEKSVKPIEQGLVSGILKMQETVMQTMGYMIGAALGGVIRFLTDAVSLFVIGIIGFINQQMGSQKSVDSTSEGLGTLISGMFGNVGKFLGGLGVGFWSQIQMALNGPVAQLMDKEWTKFTENLSTAWNRTMGNIQSAASTAWISLTTGVTAVAVAVGFIWNTMTQSIATAFTTAKTNVVTTIGLLSVELGTKVESIRAAVAVGFELIKLKMSNAIEEAKAAVVNTFNSIKEGAATAIDSLRATVEEKFGGIKAWIAGLTFTNPFSSVINWANGAISAVQNAINVISGASGAGSGGGSGKKNAAGTPFFTGGMTLVGERGPEMVYLPRGSRIENAEATAAIGGGDVYVTVNASVASGVDVETLAWQIAQKVTERRRR